MEQIEEMREISSQYQTAIVDFISMLDDGILKIYDTDNDVVKNSIISSIRQINKVNLTIIIKLFLEVNLNPKPSHVSQKIIQFNLISSTASVLLQLKLESNKYKSVRNFPFSNKQILFFDFHSPQFSKEILGVHRNASEKQIKTAYYKLAREYHPDVNTEKNAHSRFSQINTAYQHMINSMDQANRQNTTSQQQKQSTTNQYSKNYQKAKQQKTKHRPPPPEEEEQISEQDFQEFQKAFRSFINKGKIDPKHRAYSRFFAEFFTSRQDPEDMFASMHETQNEDFMSSRDLKLVTINAKLNITPEQALNGATKNILYKKTVSCGSCFGKNPETKKIKCRKCSGSGFVGKGLDDIHCCSACNGNGTVKNHGCKECRGRGIVEIYAQEPVKVAAGSFQNQEIILKGRGNQHPKKFYYGDVYIKLKISNKPLVRVDGMNTFSSIKLSISDAILGTTIEYATLKGNKNFQVQTGITDNEQVILKGEGVRKGNKTGDHFLKIKIDIPKSISKKEEEIYRKLRELQKKKSSSSFK